MTDYSEWMERYPFLRIEDNSTCPWYDHDACWLNDIPVGWIDTCIKPMCEELVCVLNDHVNDFLILQLKEKFSEIRMYWCWKDRDYTDEESLVMNQMYDSIADILRKYANLSYNTCSNCGKPATKWTSGWTLGFCDDCYSI